jgi:hypothetical protein
VLHSDKGSQAWAPALETRATAKAGVDRPFASVALVAKLATPRVVDPSDGMAVEPSALLSLHRMYAQAPVAGRTCGPAFPLREVSWPKSAQTCSSPEAGAETPALLLSASISLPPGSVETAALRQEQAPAPVSVSWLRVVQQTHRVLAHDGIPAIELTIWRSRWPGRSPRRSSSCGGRGTIPFDGIRSPGQLGAGDRIGDQGARPDHAARRPPHAKLHGPCAGCQRAGIAAARQQLALVTPRTKLDRAPSARAAV